MASTQERTVSISADSKASNRSKELDPATFDLEIQELKTFVKRMELRNVPRSSAAVPDPPRSHVLAKLSLLRPFLESIPKILQKLRGTWSRVSSGIQVVGEFSVVEMHLGIVKERGVEE